MCSNDRCVDDAPIVVHFQLQCLVVDVFDGDLGGLNDIGSGNTCFRLFEAPHKEATGGNPLPSKTSAQMADNAWTNLYTGTSTTGILAESGDYFYQVDVSLADNCSGTVLSTAKISNLSKLRSNSQIGKELGDVVFEGADTDGDFVVATNFAYGNYDYNGAFDFSIDVATAIALRVAVREPRY